MFNDEGWDYSKHDVRDQETAKKLQKIRSDLGPDPLASDRNDNDNLVQVGLPEEAT